MKTLSSESENEDMLGPFYNPQGLVPSHGAKTSDPGNFEVKLGTRSK